METIGIARVLTAIKREIRAAQMVAIGEPKLELEEVQLDLNATVNTEGGASASLQILPLQIEAGVGESTSTLRTQRISLTLEPPRPEVLQEEARGGLGLADMIVSVRKELQKGLSETPKLEPRSLRIELNFGVGEQTEAKGGFNFILVRAGASGSYRQERVQTLTVVFRRPSLP